MKNICRIYISNHLHKDQSIELDKIKAHYLLNVLRKKCGDVLRVFNGNDGEWLAEVLEYDKKFLITKIIKNLRLQTSRQELKLIFAPLKQTRLNFVIEKSVELGVTELIPILTDYTHVREFNQARAQNISIEAAEQCERLSTPIIRPLTTLEIFLKTWPTNKLIFIGDERLTSKNLIKQILCEMPFEPSLLIGPEGGFSPHEFEILSTYEFVRFVSLGQTILRAETAAIAGLAICHMAKELGASNEKIVL